MKLSTSFAFVGMIAFAGVAMAASLIHRPELFLMDEPFAALDALTRRRMQDELLQLWADTRFTVMFVTHSIAEAIRIGNRILLLSPHPGRVRAEIDGVDRIDPHDGSAARLEARIHDLLFTERGTEDVDQVDAIPEHADV